MKSRQLWPWTILFLGVVIISQLPTIARAQDQQDDQQYQDQPQDQGPDQAQDQGQDPPGRVGRLDYSQGSVSFRPAGEDDWVTAVPNRPMVTGDDLWADENSRAEVHVGSTALRLGPKTGITFLGLDDHTTQIRLAQGSLIMRVRHVDDDDNYEIDAPNLAFTLLQPGTYRLDVSEDGSRTNVTVWHGRGRVTGGGFTYTVVAGQSASFTGDQQHLDYDLGQIPDRDDFDTWAFDRDDREDRADSANYVSREMTGYEDLDEYGEWSYEPGYGPCWRPRAVVVGWAPYRYGHWAYVGPWGWTWVEDEPWGFAPFHYGRWAYVNSGWYWVPGPVVVRPVWAPAMVAWVGGSPVGGGVAWVPLAPGEVYVPAYHVSRVYVNNVNITNTNVNVTHVTNVYNTVIVNKSTTINNVTYVNQRVNNGVTVVSHDAFVNAKPVAQNAVRVDPKELERAPVTRTVAAEPVRASVAGAGRPVTVRPPAPVLKRTVVAVRTPPAPPRSIEQRQAAAGGHLNEQALVRPAGPARPAPVNPAERQAEQRPQQQPGRAQQPERTQPSQEGFHPFTPPNGGNQQVHQMPNTQPRTYEQQGTAQQEGQRTPQPEEPRNTQPPNPERRVQPTNPGFRESQREQAAPSESHPLVRPTPPVQQRTPQQEEQQAQKFNQWKQQRPSSPPPQRESRPSPPPKQERPKH